MRSLQINMEINDTFGELLTDRRMVMRQSAEGRAMSDLALCLGVFKIARRLFQLIDRLTTSRRCLRTDTARLRA
jgi:hypothetical protein